MVTLTVLSPKGERVLHRVVAGVVDQGRACDLLRQCGTIADALLEIDFSGHATALETLLHTLESPLVVASAALSLMRDQGAGTLRIVLGESSALDQAAVDPLPDAAVAAFWRQWVSDQRAHLNRRSAPVEVLLVTG